MSLTKAAEALNKILYGEKGPYESNLSTLLSPSCHLGTSNPPAESLGENKVVCNYWSEEAKSRTDKLAKGLNTESLDRICVAHTTAFVNDDVENRSQDSISTIAVSTSGVLNRSKESGTSLAVVSLPQKPSNVLPLIEKILNVEVNSVTENEEFTPLDPSKYKTELCRSYQVHGYCKYGNRCNYAHGLSQLKVSFRHGKYKTRNCQSYHETGCCRYGARCSFIHDVEEGILKCPITDREILEALHYDPTRELHHVATITWRTLEPNKYPPTEVHFFTSQYPTILDSSFDNSMSLKEVSSQASIEEITSTDEPSMESESYSARQASDEEQCLSAQHNTSSSSVDFVQMKHNATDSSLIKDTKANKTNHEIVSKNEAEQEADEPKNSEFRKFIYEDNFQAELFEQLTPNTRKRNKSRHFGENANEEHFSQATAHARGLRSSGMKFIQRYSNEKDLMYSNCSQSFPDFRLNDFLECLKSREGRHLSTWKTNWRNSSSSLDSMSNVQPSSFSLRSSSCRSARDWAKYKTELCRSYQYNRYCEYNEACLYAHGTHDLKTYPKHPLYRTKKCFSFHKKGFCLYGSRCQFLHDIETSLSS